MEKKVVTRIRAERRKIRNFRKKKGYDQKTELCSVTEPNENEVVTFKNDKAIEVVQEFNKIIDQIAENFPEEDLSDPVQNLEENDQINPTEPVEVQPVEVQPEQKESVEVQP